MDKVRADTVHTIAVAFIEGLADQLGPQNLSELRARSAAHTDPLVCVSHDYCDANQFMWEAITRVAGAADHFPWASIVSIWSAAWRLARQWNFEVPHAPL